MAFFNIQEMQKEREAKLITLLKNRLEPFVEGQVDEFLNWANSEARRRSAAGMVSSCNGMLCYFKNQNSHQSHYVAAPENSQVRAREAAIQCS